MSQQCTKPNESYLFVAMLIDDILFFATISRCNAGESLFNRVVSRFFVNLGKTKIYDLKVYLITGAFLGNACCHHIFWFEIVMGNTQAVHVIDSHL